MVAIVGEEGQAATTVTGKHSKQVWVSAFVWHPTKTSCQIPVEVLVDTGAGGDNYASVAFMYSIECRGGGGQSLTSSRGQGWLRVASPTNSAVPPMKIPGSCELPLLFSQEDKMRKGLVRVVEGLPCELIIGAAFTRKHGSVKASP